MNTCLQNPLTRVWAFLAIITLGSWWYSQSNGMQATANVPLTLSVLVIAFVKVRFVIWHFMEVKVAPLWLKRSCDGWLAGTALLIISCYLVMLP